MTTTPIVPLTIAYSPGYLDWRLGVGHPTNPERARIAVELLELWESVSEDVEITWHEPRLDFDGVLTAARTVHTDAYLRELAAGNCGEWSGTNTVLRDTAALMFQGTADLVEDLVAHWGPGVWFNPQGAKHHAHADHASGFCVLNDMAWAARRLASIGKKVLYVDWDAHHGDGVEALLADSPDLITCSIHDGTVFPGTGRTSRPEQGVHNWALAAGSSDDELTRAMREIVALIHAERPDVVLLACGADGLAADPLATLRYSLDGIEAAAAALGAAIAQRDLPVIVGGAGGYQPLTETPAAWALTIRRLYEAFLMVEAVDPDDPWQQFCRDGHGDAA